MDRFNTAVAIVLATILIAALATGSGWGMLRLSEHISADASSLLQGLFVIIVFIERASAILKALSDFCVGFNQGLRRGRFVEL